MMRKVSSCSIAGFHSRMSIPTVPATTSAVKFLALSSTLPQTQEHTETRAPKTSIRETAKTESLRASSWMRCDTSSSEVSALIIDVFPDSPSPMAARSMVVLGCPLSTALRTYCMVGTAPCSAISGGGLKRRGFSLQLRLARVEFAHSKGSGSFSRRLRETSRAVRCVRRCTPPGSSSSPHRERSSVLALTAPSSTPCAAPCCSKRWARNASSAASSLIGSETFHVSSGFSSGSDSWLRVVRCDSAFSAGTSHHPPAFGFFPPTLGSFRLSSAVQEARAWPSTWSGWLEIESLPGGLSRLRIVSAVRPCRSEASAAPSRAWNWLFARCKARRRTLPASADPSAAIDSSLQRCRLSVSSPEIASGILHRTDSTISSPSGSESVSDLSVDKRAAFSVSQGARWAAEKAFPDRSSSVRAVSGASTNALAIACSRWWNNVRVAYMPLPASESETMFVQRRRLATMNPASASRSSCEFPFCASPLKSLERSTRSAPRGMTLLPSCVNEVLSCSASNGALPAACSAVASGNFRLCSTVLFRSTLNATLDASTSVRSTSTPNRMALNGTFRFLTLCR
eukprot:3549326-Rhodomonas_salina.2